MRTLLKGVNDDASGNLGVWLTGQANIDPTFRKGHEGNCMIRTLPDFMDHLRDTQGKWRETRGALDHYAQIMNPWQVMKYLSSRPSERLMETKH